MTRLLGDNSSAKPQAAPQGRASCVWTSQPETLPSLPPGDAQELALASLELVGRGALAQLGGERWGVGRGKPEGVGH